MAHWHQSPDPGTRRLFHAGDTLTVKLFSGQPHEGTAWLRTNLGRAHLRRRELIDHAERRAPILARDWHDLPMSATATPGVFEIQFPLFETGRFEAKTFFLPADGGKPAWPDGDNLVIKVEPSLAFCANTLYTAFVRQFGPNMRKNQELPLPPETLTLLDDNGCTVIPKSGTFRSLAAQLDHIIHALGFRIIQLLPIHPVPTTFARMGRFGSPFASIDFFDVDPALAEFDRQRTPLDQFAELADGIHQRGALLFLDLPINHTGWASHLQLHHPEWFARNGDHSFASPGAWGVTWEDLSELDYRHRGLWHYMADVFLFWCRHGVDGFRCDAGYMVPMPVWQYIVAKVREVYPDTLFLLEGLGGKISVMRDLLDQGNLNWAYSEIFQVYDRGHLESQLPGYHDISQTSGTLMHFAETHDNNRLAAQSKRFARLRTALAALCSEGGAFGITNGVEWFAEAKIDVHGAPPLNWDSPVNQIAAIRRLNTLLRTHPAFSPGTRLRVIPSGGTVFTLLRIPSEAPPVLVLANLNTEQSADAAWPASVFAPGDSGMHDLFGGDAVNLSSAGNGMLGCALAPGQVMCLDHQPLPDDPVQEESGLLRMQRMKAAALAIYVRLAAPTLPPTVSAATLAADLEQDPERYCETVSDAPAPACLTVWHWPGDSRRLVMLPAGHMLLVRSPHPFRAELHTAPHTVLTAVASLPCSGGGNHFAFLIPTSTHDAEAEITLHLAIQTPEGMVHSRAGILQLATGTACTARLRFGREALRDSRRCALLANGTGAMSQVRLEWSRIVSQYDCILAANLHDRVPVDRRILFTRCRAWLVYKGYSHEIGVDCTRHARVDPGRAVHWHFDVPAGLGRTVPLSFSLRLARHRNRVSMVIRRLPATTGRDPLAHTAPVALILRPDIEDRSFHEVAKAHTGPEHRWPSSVTPFENGFRFASDTHAPMCMTLDGGHFTHEPEWQYGVPHPFEADRGLAPDADLFSPGYFTCELNGGTTVCLEAFVEDEAPPAGDDGTPAMTADGDNADHPTAGHQPLRAVLHRAIRDFIVRRDDSLTVIAGYPWFLDWGRDTLICLRGIIAAGMVEEARDILLQFAGFEDRGTLPNMIRGTDDRDRDTSDAPLWFFTACADLLAAEGHSDLLQADCNGRSLAKVLRSIATHIITGTPNGIVMDPASGLVFSPAHFTWMDTHYPAGTPREGYPIEIQALWHAALKLLSRIDSDPSWAALANRTRDAITRLFPLNDRDYLADCLHAKPGTPAESAVPDNALRPNQIFTITLGAVTDPVLMRGILNATAELLIPGAIRSLADQPVFPPLPITGRNGESLNDPCNPYWGEYRGDEDTRRKPAYHNGTAWTWPFPSYCEALSMLDPVTLTPTACSLLSSLCRRIDEGCVGHLPEILDGNTPHRQRGCGAQAWSVTEAFRVLTLLASGDDAHPRGT